MDSTKALPPAGQIFEKIHSLRILSILANFLYLSSRGLARVLPPVGQIFEKWHLLKKFDDFRFVCNFQAGC